MSIPKMELQRFPMPSSMVLLHYLLLFSATASADQDPKDHQFIFHGFHNASSALSLNGIAFVHPNGLLQLTNKSYWQIGRAFYQHPIPFASNTSNGSLVSSSSSSFSTCFVFAIAREHREFSGHGLAFTISPSTELPGTLASQFLGLFNASTFKKSSINLFAVELDTIQNLEMLEVDDNHVGIDVKSLISTQSAPAAYYDGAQGKNRSLDLLSGDPMKVWIEYDGTKNQLNVTISPLEEPKPQLPLLSSSIDLSSVLIDSMYVGFSSSTGSIASSHYILGWSFKLNGPAEEINISLLPPLPPGTKRVRRPLPLALSLAAAALISLAVISGAIFSTRKKKYEELLEDWEQDYGPQRFSYKDLSIATKGFKELLGAGGFGKVYHGILPKSNLQVAVKRVSHDSKQGMKEFIAEIASIGRLRHRNLVQLLGYCRRRGELLLVYDFMPNGSVDKLLYAHERESIILDWNRRFRILQGVASALQYLHEEWNQVVVHRDVKASNVLLDADMNGRLGDFGLARLYDHGSNLQTTRVVGTFGYIAPEMARTGKATTSTDVFAFGAFMLEVACGRRPILSMGSSSSDEKMVLVEYVWEWWRRGRILGVADPKLGSDYVAEEMELVLKLGLLCSQSVSAARPSMRQVVQFLDGNAVLLQPDLPMEGQDYQQLYASFASSWEPAGLLNSSSVSEAVLSGGR